MSFDSESPPPPAKLLRRLRALSLAGDELALIRLVRGLSHSDAIALLDAVGMHRWDEDSRSVVDKTASQWRSMPKGMRNLSRRLPIKAHAALLVRVSPRAFAEPRLPNKAVKARLSKEAVSAMERRRGRRQALRHPEDDFELIDRIKKFVGTIFDCAPDGRKEYRSRVHRTHLDGWNSTSQEAG